jgi:hypothetical protein
MLRVVRPFCKAIGDEGSEQRRRANTEAALPMTNEPYSCSAPDDRASADWCELSPKPQLGRSGGYRNYNALSNNHID